MIQCRKCAVTISNPKPMNIFEDENMEVLQNIEIITGIQVNYD